MKVTYYHQCQEVLAASRNTAQLHIQLEENGNYQGELTFSWCKISTAEPAVELKAFDDSWIGLNKFCFQFLPELEAIPTKTPEAIAQVLSNAGATDITLEVFPPN